MVQETGSRASGIAATPTHPLASKAGDLRPDSGSRIHGSLSKMIPNRKGKAAKKL
jgi:hypothetical protein